MEITIGEFTTTFSNYVRVKLEKALSEMGQNIYRSLVVHLPTVDENWSVEKQYLSSWWWHTV